MLLDWVESTKLFVLRVPRSDSIDIFELRTSYGLDFSVPASTPQEAVLFTGEPYAAASFAEFATPAAYTKLKGILDAVALSRAPEGEGHFRVPADRELWPFQKASLSYALARDHSLIGDEPGLGKTEIAIAYANEIDAQRVLIICPANIRFQWQTRIYEWSTMPQPFHVDVVTKGKHGVHPDCPWTVVSYDLARTPAIAQALAANHYDLLILDEAHYVKTIDSKRTRCIFGGGENRVADPLFERATHTLALTGTPLPNRPREAYTLARGLCWDAIDWASEDDFRERYNPSMVVQTASGARYVDERSGRHGELQNRLRANFMARHLKREVMPQLKLPVYDLVYLEQTKAVKSALEAESLLGIDPDMFDGCDFSPEKMGAIAAARRMMGLAMAPQVADYMEMLLEGGEDKLVLFGWHIGVLDILCERLAKWSPVRIDGSTGARQKQERVNTFVKDPNRHVIVGNIQSMGTGTDGLQLVSGHALVCEPSWVHSENVQAFDRLDRGGQTRQVQGDIFVVHNSLAEKILGTALKKGQVTHAALDRRFLADAD
jgi:SWI/SNF-related matrix-associated actin-dependent regulator of chromatin subfamily A-like protein 1